MHRKIFREVDYLRRTGKAVVKVKEIYGVGFRGAHSYVHIVRRHVLPAIPIFFVNGIIRGVKIIERVVAAARGYRGRDDRCAVFKIHSPALNREIARCERAALVHVVVFAPFDFSLVRRIINFGGYYTAVGINGGAVAGNGFDHRIFRNRKRNRLRAAREDAADWIGGDVRIRARGYGVENMRGVRIAVVYRDINRTFILAARRRNDRLRNLHNGRARVNHKRFERDKCLRLDK